MHGESFTERFRSKNTSPPHTGNTKPQKPATLGRPRAKRLIGAPFEFVAEVCRLTAGRAALVVALYIYRRVQICDNRTVTLPSGELAELGIVPQYKQTALMKLQRAGLVKVENESGRTARVTLIWQQDQPSLPR
jgi:hypothetical protein